MVNTIVRLANLGPVPQLSAADDLARPLLWRLEPTQRAMVVMALLGVVVAGLGLIALAAISGRRLRRIARERPGPTPRGHDDWYRKPLVPAEPNDPPSPEAP